MIAVLISRFLIDLHEASSNRSQPTHLQSLPSIGSLHIGRAIGPLDSPLPAWGGAPRAPDVLNDEGGDDDDHYRTVASQ